MKLPSFHPVISNKFFRIVLIIGLVIGQALPGISAQASSPLSITPLTWNVVGLDSNNVTVGPDTFPVGARVCNTGSQVDNLLADFSWDSDNANINLSPKSLSSIPLASLGAGSPSSPTCFDFYFNVTVARTTAAFNTSRRYHISVAAGAETLTTPKPREIKVEKLVSQNRNHIAGFKINDAAYTPGTTEHLQVGKTYTIEMDGATATRGYNQLEDFINFPNAIFQVLSVATHYSADSSTFVSNPSDKLYGDACLYDANPDSPTYRSCTGSDGKVGGTISTTYTVKVIGGAGTTHSLNSLIYDFSGASYHYNGDFSSLVLQVAISSPLAVSKSFSPVSISPGGISTLSIVITNNSDSPAAGASLADPLPSLPAQMTVAADPGASTSGCLNAGFAPQGGDTVLNFSGDIPANGTCKIEVNVTAPAAGTYTNTTGHLMLNGSDTGLAARANLTAASQSSGTGFCPGAETLAHWTVPGTAVNPPDLAGGFPTTKNPYVSTATAAAHLPVDTGIASNNGANADSHSWSTYGYQTSGQYIEFTLDTGQFTDISMSFWVDNPGAGNGPKSIVLSYNSGTGWNSIKTISSPPGAFTRYTQDFTGLTSPSGTTTFRLTATGATKDDSKGALLYDDILFTGKRAVSCTPVSAMPALQKTFLDSPIALNSTSRLEFMLGNANDKPLTGVSFTDVLPAGLTVADGSTPACSGTLTTTASTNTISFSGGTIPANSACSFNVSVTGAEAGTFTNTSGYISSTESGTNTAETGYGRASLVVLAPPVIAIDFSPNPIYEGNTSSLAFTLTNPNPDTALSGVSFADVLPAGLAVADSSTSACSGTLTTTTSTNTISFSGGTIPAGGSCTMEVVVTGSAAGSYPTITSAVASANGGTGNTAADTLVVQTVHPAISILKQVSASPSGPWSSKIYVSAGVNVYYRLTVENNGDVPLSLVDAEDATLDLSGCKWPAVLPVGTTTVDPTASCVVGPVSASDLAGDHPNTATAQGTYNGAAVSSDPSTATYVTTSLRLVKSVDEPSFKAADETLHYSYLVTNTGTTSLSGQVAVFDNNTSVTCPDGTTLEPGASVTCSGTYTTSAFDVTVGSVTNTAYAVVGNVYSNIDRKTVFKDQPDLVIGKTNNTNGYSFTGIPFTWTLTVSNQGPESATFEDGQTILSDQLPGPAIYGSPVAGSGTDITGDGSILCSVDSSDLLTCTASGADVTIGGVTGSFPVTIQVTPAGAGSLANTAKVDPDNVIRESNEGNNTGSDAVNISTPPSADLSITKSDDLTEVTPNQSVTYVLVVTNSGPSAADGAVLTDMPGDGLTLTDLSCQAAGGAVCPTSGNTISDLTGDGIILPALPDGGSLTFTVTASVNETTDSISNIAAVAPPYGVLDPDPAFNSATDTDTVVRIKAISLKKSASPTTYTTAGQTISYSYDLTNTGNVTLSAPFAVSDDKAADESCPAIASLAPGATVTCSASYEISQADVDSGSVTNVATATAGFGGDTVTSNPDQVTVTAVQSLALSLVKTASPTTYDAVGQEISYSYLLKNTGNVTLAGPFTVSDDRITVSCPADDSLAVGASITCTASYTIAQADLDAGKVTNLATGHASFGDEAVDSNQDMKTVNALQQGGLALTKSADPATYDTLGQTITYTYRVKNTGNITLAGPFTVNDDKTGAVSCPSGSLAPQATVTCTGTYAITQADLDEGSVTNTATASDGTLTSNEAQATVNADQKPALTLKKSASESTYAAVDDVLHYSYEVTNSGNVTLHDTIVVSDDQAADESCPTLPEDGLAPGASITCTASHTVTQADLDAGKVTNVASATSGIISSNTDTVTVTATQTPELSLKKSANPTSYTAAGQTISYSYGLKNTGNVTLVAPFAVADDRASVACPEITSLAPGASITCTASYTITQADVDSGSVTNKATGTARFGSDTVTSNQAQATVTAEVTPALSLAKTATPHFSDPVKVGNTISYELVATNTAEVTLTNVAITDPRLGTLDCSPAQPATLAPGATLACKGSYTLTQADIDAGHVASTAYATSKLPGGGNGPGGQDSQDVPVTQLPAISLVKTATEPGFTRAGDVLHYTLVATNDGNVTLNNVSISDPLLATLTCTPEQPATLAPGGQLTCTGSYTVQQSDAGAGQVKNTATVSGSFGGKDYSATGQNTIKRTHYTIYLPITSKNASPATPQTWDVALGYEDLPLSTGQNDFDYNDWVVELHNQATYAAGSQTLMQKLDLSFIPQVRGGTYNHQFQITFPAQVFPSNGTAVLSIYDQNHQRLSAQTIPFSHDKDNLFVIFSSTADIFPSMANSTEGQQSVSPRRTADLSITFDTPFQFTVDDNQYKQPHGEGLFFKPALKVWDSNELVQPGDIRLLSVNVSAWLWPEEGVRIDRAYPSVKYTPGNPPSLSFPSLWWTSHNSCVIDGQKCTLG